MRRVRPSKFGKGQGGLRRSPLGGWAAALGLFAIALASGCGPSGGESGPPSGTSGGTAVAPPASIALFATPATSTPADGASSIVVSASVLDASGKTLPSGTPVTFSIGGAYLTIAGAAPAQAVVAGVGAVATGFAQVSVTSAVQGSATLSAQSGSASASLRLAFGPLPGVPARVTVFLSPSSSVAADGTSTLTASALVSDADGVPVSAGKAVTFAITAGEVELSGGSPASSVSTTIGSVSPGLAQALVLSLTQGSAVLTASSGSATGWAPVIFTAPVTGGGGGGGGPLGSQQPASVDLTVSPASPLVANGQTAVVVATVMTGAGLAVTDGTVVQFGITNLYPSSPTLGTISSSASTVNGKAYAVYGAGTVAGSLEIVATSGSAPQVQAVSPMTLDPGPAARVTFSASPTSIAADGTSTTTLTAVVTDLYGNLVKDGTSVVFSTAGGKLGTGSGSTLHGIAQTTLTSSTTAGGVTVTAIVGSVVGSVLVTLTPVSGGGTILGTIAFTTLPQSLEANKQTALVQVTLKTTSGQGVPDGTGVYFYLSPPTGPGGAIQPFAQTSGGVASVIYSTPTTSGAVVIQAAAGSSPTLYAFGSISLLPGPPYQMILTAPSTLPPDGTTSAQITSFTVDSYGNPIKDGTSVSFSTSLGTLSSANGSTLGGRAVVNLTSSTTTGTATVNAAIGSVVSAAAVQMIYGTGSGTGAPSSISVSVSPSALQVTGTGGVSTTNLSASAFDSQGGIATQVAFFVFQIVSGPGGGESIDGYASGSTVVVPVQPAGSGIAAATLSSGNLSGALSVKVTAVAPSASVSTILPQISISSGPPWTIFLTDSEFVVPNGDGTLSHGISALVKDVYNNPVADGTAVYFTAIDRMTIPVTSGTAGTVPSPAYAFEDLSQGSWPNVDPGDILVIQGGINQGNYFIKGIGYQGTWGSTPGADVLDANPGLIVDGLRQDAGLVQYYVFRSALQENDFAAGTNLVLSAGSYTAHAVGSPVPNLSMVSIDDPAKGIQGDNLIVVDVYNTAVSSNNTGAYKIVGVDNFAQAITTQTPFNGSAPGGLRYLVGRSEQVIIDGSVSTGNASPCGSSVNIVPGVAHTCVTYAGSSIHTPYMVAAQSKSQALAIGATLFTATRGVHPVQIAPFSIPNQSSTPSPVLLPFAVLISDSSGPPPYNLLREGVGVTADHGGRAYCMVEAPDQFPDIGMTDESGYVVGELRYPSGLTTDTYVVIFTAGGLSAQTSFAVK